VGVAVFAIVMVISGRMMPKYGPKKLTIASGISLGLLPSRILSKS